MAKMCNAKVKAKSGGYERLFNNKDLGLLFSKAQSTVISNGSELEKIILSKVNLIDDLDEFIEKVTNGDINDGTFVCNKKKLQRSRYYLKGHQPDLLIFIVGRRRICKIIELKDGDSFDTKKSAGEYESLNKFKDFLGAKIPFIVEYFICCFNQLDKKAIVKGFKNRFNENEVMTGQEFCNILNIDYDEIKNTRLTDAEDNINYLIDELLKCPEIKSLIEEKIK